MITSIANKQVKHIIQLQKKARLRREENVFIAEGPRMVIETPKEMLEEIYVAESFEDTWDGPVDEIVSDAVMKAMSDTQTPQGVLAVVKRPSYDLEDILARRPAHLLLVEGIQDPGNLGTMFRTGRRRYRCDHAQDDGRSFSSKDRALDHGKPLPGAFLCGRRLGKRPA